MFKVLYLIYFIRTRPKNYFEYKNYFGILFVPAVALTSITICTIYSDVQGIKNLLESFLAGQPCVHKVAPRTSGTLTTIQIFTTDSIFNILDRRQFAVEGFVIVPTVIALFEACIGCSWRVESHINISCQVGVPIATDSHLHHTTKFRHFRNNIHKQIVYNLLQFLWGHHFELVFRIRAGIFVGQPWIVKHFPEHHCIRGLRFHVTTGAERTMPTGPDSVVEGTPRLFVG